MQDHTLTTSALKTCTKCGVTKPLTDFARAKQGTFGRYSICKQCKRELKRVWHTENRESQNEKARIYQEQHRAELVSKKRDVYRARRQEFVEDARKRYAADPTKYRDVARAQRKKNPLRHRAHAAVALAVKMGKFPPAWTMVCEGCQEAQSAHWHHHRGYAPEFRLHVVALCTDCHGKAHWADYD